MSTTVSPTASSSHRKRLVLLIWILVGVFYFYLSWGYIRVTMDDQQFDDYLQYVVNVAGGEGRPSKEIRALLLVRAEQLSLPISGEQITIQGGGPTLSIRVNYSVDIDIPVLRSTVYTKQFSHSAKYQIPNR
jgi:hypothetical protein